MALKKEYKIEKFNTLNEMKSTSMTLQEVRFLTIYLSKINKSKPETRVVRFSLEDFRKIMDLGRLNIDNLKGNTARLLQKIATIDNKNGGYHQFQLFKEIELDKDEKNEWFVQIDCHDKALPLMFEFKDKYFTYELWNALRLKSPNQIRVYEILKQYEKLRERTIKIEELRGLLGIKPEEYPRFEAFKRRVIDATQEALKESTDICFEYELVKKGAKVTAIKFLIFKNEDYIDQICLEEFIEMQKQENEETEIEVDTKKVAESREEEIIKAYGEMTALSKNNLSDDEIMNLNQSAFEYLLEAQRIGESPLLEQAEYVKKQALYANSKKNVKNYYPYLVTAIEKNFAGA